MSNQHPTATASERWYRLLLRLYPADFRDEMGTGFVETYLDRTRTAAQTGGTFAVARVWMRALGDSMANGLAERLRPSIAWRRAGNWGRDAEIAFRRLRRAPAFTLSMLGTLIIGLGTFAVVFTVIDKVLIVPPHYERPNDLYFVWRDYTSFFDLNRGWLGGPDVAALDTAGGPIVAATGLRIDRRTLVTAGSTADPEEVRTMITSANVFTVLGVRPFIGRTFAANEDGVGRTGTIVLSHALWQRRFGGDRSALGASVQLNGEPFTVIGVLPSDFNFVRLSSTGPPDPADAYITFPYALAARPAGSGAFAGLIRARPGATPATVHDAVARVGRSIDEKYFRKRGLKLYPVGLHEDLVRGIRPALVILGVSGAFLVIVLCANLAALLLGRAVQRGREFAVSRALGANAAALVRATLFEATMLGAAGGAGASIVAVWGTRVLVRFAPADMPMRDAIHVDARVAVAMIGIGALLGVIAGLAPALWVSRTNLASLLRNAALRGGAASYLRRSLVVVQVALCLTLLSTGGLVARSFGALLRSQPGFDARGVMTMRVPIAQWMYPDNASAVAFDGRLERALAELPGVESVGAASAVPLAGNTDQSDVVLPGAPGNNGQHEHDTPLADIIQSRPGWFTTLGIRVISGRDFEAPRPGRKREAIIDRTLATQFYPSGDAVGTRVIVGSDTLPVVGVVEHARQYDLHRDGRPQVYLRDEDDTYGALYFAVRSPRDPLDVAADVRALVHRLEPRLALSEMRPMTDFVDESLRNQRASAVLVGGFSFGALVLAAMGLFGVVAGSVTRRRHELAVRLALGATHGGVVRMVLGEGARLTAIGIVLAAPGVYVAGRMARAILIGVSPFDAATLTVVVLGLMAVALLACYLPARRVGSIDPAGVLREQ